jgi:hypothetical protein
LRQLCADLYTNACLVDPEQLRRGAAEDRNAVVVAESRDRQDVVDRDAVPRKRVVAADCDLADAGLRAACKKEMALLGWTICGETAR